MSTRKQVLRQGEAVPRSVPQKTISGYVPILKCMNVDFLKPALTDLTAEVCFSESDIQKMKAQLEAEGRYDFELESKIQDTNETIVVMGKALYAIRKCVNWPSKLSSELPRAQ